jgi:two-component system cell cycle response regulator
VTPADQEADQALRDARSRFVAGFTPRHTAMGTLLTSFSVDLDPAPLKSLRDAAHKLAGLAGVLGFPSVSEQAAALEVALLADPVDPEVARDALKQMGAGFAHDLAGTAPSWAQDARPVAVGARILLVEDEPDQRRLAASGLRAAGYRVVTAESGAEAVHTARTERPELILLDIDLPDLDGMAVCRQLKLDPALAAIPVIFCSARTSVMDRMAGLTLGADDYITKPFVPSELLLRIGRLLTRTATGARSPTAPPPTNRAMTYEMFAPAATDLLSRAPAAIALMRIAPADIDRLTAQLMEDLRRRDMLGQFSDGHLIAVMPGLSASTAKSTLRGMIDSITPPLESCAIGTADPESAGTAALDALIAHADLALAQDRVAQSGLVSGQKTILLAEDDPDVLHIIDTRLKAAGYRTVLALDGQQALDALGKESPAVVLLDLMMPKLTGFDVLIKIRERAQRPRIIVVSGRGRDEDVTRAFDLGADDYITKPFNPDELIARLARLTR